MENVRREADEVKDLPLNGEAIVPNLNLLSPFPAVKRSPSFPDLKEELRFATKTPEKAIISARNTDVEVLEYEVPKRFLPLVELFDWMLCSLTLLHLREKPQTFHNVSTQVSIMAKRNLTCDEFARMKFIIPDVLQIQKIIIHDQKTLSKKDDMKISLFSDSKGTLNHVALHKFFVSRLVILSEKLREVDNVPLATLPHPFTNVEELSDAQEGSITRSDDQPIVDSQSAEEFSRERTSHFPPSFTRRFSSKGKDKLSEPNCRKIVVSEAKSTIHGEGLSESSSSDKGKVESTVHVEGICESSAPTNDIAVTPEQSASVNTFGFEKSCEKDLDSAFLPVKRSLEFSKSQP